MAGVITDACIKCKHMACVEVCPVDAFYEGENMLVINPLECVDCGCCIERCPIDAIAFDTDPVAKPWVELNAAYSKLWPNVTFDGGQTPDDAEQFRAVRGKFEAYFSPQPGKGDLGRSGRMKHDACGRCRQENVLRRLIWKGRALKYLLAIILFCVLISTVSSMEPAQIPKWEEGTFREGESGSVITVRNGSISYAGSKAQYDLWIGKGKRFLSTKSILGDLYVLDANGNKAPATIIIDNMRGASTACSIRNGDNEVCFRRAAQATGGTQKQPV